MKNVPLLVTTIVAFSTIIGASLATVTMRANASNQATASLQTPIASQESKPAFSNTNTSLPLVQAQQPDASTSPIAEASDTALDDFPHQRLILQDGVTPDREFYQFREQVRQAVRNRDAAFIQALIPANGLSLGFGRPLDLQTLNLSNPNAHIWGILEKAIAPGCQELPQSNYPNTDPTAGVWSCPNVNYAFYQQYPKPADAQGIDYEISRMIIVGQSVNVRARASIDSPAVGVLTDEVVQFDRQAWEQIRAADRAAQLESLDSWIPIILPNGQHGYVSNRYAYSPLGYQVVFAKVNGQWQILYIPGGD